MRFTKKIYGDPIVNAIIAEMEGQKTHTRPYAWIDGDKRYSHITGAIILPTFDQPGYLLTIAVNHNDINDFECLNEFESADPYSLIRKAQDIQTEYGPEVISNWWGNAEELMSLVNEINIQGNPVRIAPPIDSDQTDAFQIYVARVKVALSADYKTLMINDCQLLRNYISAFVQEKSAKAENNPAMYVIGALLHTLLIVRPWEQAVETVQLIPTTTEEYAAYANEQAEKEIFAEIYGGRA